MCQFIKCKINGRFCGRGVVPGSASGEVWCSEHRGMPGRLVGCGGDFWLTSS